MSSTVRWVLLASLLLLSTAAVTFYVAQRKADAQAQHLANGAQEDVFAGLAPDTNRWHVFGLLSAAGGLALGISGLMVWRQDRGGDQRTANDLLGHRP